MYQEDLFTYFKVYEKIGNKVLTEKEMHEVAISHFDDIVETFGLSNSSYMEKYDETRLAGRKKVFHYKIVQGYLPKGYKQH